MNFHNVKDSRHTWIRQITSVNLFKLTRRCNWRILFLYIMQMKEGRGRKMRKVRDTWWNLVCRKIFASPYLFFFFCFLRNDDWSLLLLLSLSSSSTISVPVSVPRPTLERLDHRSLFSPHYRPRAAAGKFNPLPNSWISGLHHGLFQTWPEATNFHLSALRPKVDRTLEG